MVFDRTIKTLKELFRIGRKNKIAFYAPLSIVVIDIILYIAYMLFIFVPIIYGWQRITSEEQFYTYLILPTITLLILNLLNHTFFGTAHSWIIYRVYKRKPVSFRSALRVAIKDYKDVLTLTLLGVLVKILLSFTRKQKGFLARLLGGAIAHGWSITYKFTIPAMVIKDQTVWQAIRKDVPKLLKAIPATLIGQFAVEPISKVFLSIVGFFWTFAVLFLFFAVLPVVPYVTLITVLSLLFLYLVFSMTLYLYIRITYFTILYIWLKDTKRPTLENAPPIVKNLLGR